MNKFNTENLRQNQKELLELLELLEILNNSSEMSDVDKEELLKTLQKEIDSTEKLEEFYKNQNI